MAKKTRIKLPKRLLGAKLPKEPRKRLNKMLQRVSARDANPLVAAAVGSIATLLAERLEEPLEALLTHGSRTNRQANRGAQTH